MPTRICFIRHGQTDWNAARRIQGQIDVPLNEAGQAQALAMAIDSAQHQFSAIYSSDLVRACDSAQQIAARHGQEVVKLPQLRERHFGIFQGITAEEGARRHPEAYARYRARDPDYDFQTGESLQNFVLRVHRVVAWMVARHRGQTIAAVCHAGVLDAVYRKATGLPMQAPRDFAIPNCALNWFSFDDHSTDAGWHLERWGDPGPARVAQELTE